MIVLRGLFVSVALYPPLLGALARVNLFTYIVALAATFVMGLVISSTVVWGE